MNPRRIVTQDTLREQLRDQLQTLPPTAFEHLIARLLKSSGYAEVQVLGGSQGGADLSASVPNGLSQAVTLVQAKQYRAPVSRRFVDELRGAMLRMGAQQGVLLTTSSFYLPAYRAVWKPCPFPVRLVDGAKLIDLLLAHRVGVVPGAKGHLKLDRAYFAQLRRDHGGGRRPGIATVPKPPVSRDCAAPNPNQGTGRRSWLDSFWGN